MALVLVNEVCVFRILVAVFVMLCVKTILSSGLELVSEDLKMTVGSRCIEKERQALFEIKRGIVDTDDVLSSWGSRKDCCQWSGVECDNQTGRVTQLHLYYVNRHSFYNYLSPIVSNMSRSFLDLENLNYLDLSWNDFGGLPIPEFIGSLAKLVYLDLSNARFGGVIPDQLGNLSKLNHLDLNYNSFDLVSIPKFIGSVTSLTYLGLSGNQFSGAIPNQLANLSNLNHLDLSSGSFDSSPIPNFIGSLTSLAYLDLSGSQFSGAIPNQLANLSKLNYLDLGYNSLDASPIPTFIGSFTSLVYLGLARNQFLGAIPHQFANLSKLNHLDLGYNSVLDGGIFGWLFHLSSLTHLDLSGIDVGTPNNWVELIQRLPSLSVLHLNDCNLNSTIVPSSFSTNNSSPISTLHLRRNVFNLSIFGLLSKLNGSLVDLDLGFNQLKGKIPESFAHMIAIKSLDLSGNQLDGVVAASFLNVSSLEFIDFSSNNLIGNLQDVLNVFSEDSLQVLLISENQLTGSLPDITRFSFLRDLQVRSNQLTGYLPKHFEHNTVLQTMDLSNNSLRGSLPNFTGFSYLLNLYLNDNKFSGSVPDFTGCSSLQTLLLRGNQFTEWETQSIGLLTTLNQLDLSMNLIGSTISETHLSNLSNLWYMNASHNSLTFNISSEWLPPFQILELSLASCNLGPKFPNWIRNQAEIYSLDFSDSQISDTIPMWFWNVSSTMDLLHLSSNKIRGKIPYVLFNFQDIDLSSNYFEGPLPLFSSRCSKINLSQNKFSGTLLSLNVVKDMSLSFLDLSHNLLFGALPDNWVFFQDLVFLNLGYNKFSGGIPLTLGHLVSLQTLILRKNSLYGELPASLRNCRDLGFVDFGLNSLSGKVPAWIGEDLPKLYALILRSNKFYGSMPFYLCHLSNLHFLDLSINKISGNVPQCFYNLTAMIQKGTEITEHHYNSTYASAPTASYVDTALAGWKGQELEYGRNFAYLKMIDLSHNDLTGEFPIGLTRLLDLKGLNLSRNKFYGRVPLDIGRLKMLESLDLSRNRFSDKLPQSLSGLSFLGYLDG